MNVFAMLAATTRFALEPPPPTATVLTPTAPDGDSDVEGADGGACDTCCSARFALDGRTIKLDVALSLIESSGFWER